MAKMLIELSGIRVAFGTRTVLDIDHFALHEGERVGLVGENGAGKTTLLRVLKGELTPEQGVVKSLAPVTYIRQMDEHGQTHVDDARLISLFDVKPEGDALSGGERTRRRIAAALGASAGVLLADEPTADLDASGIELLERALLSFTGALILVSHDRALLGRVCNCIVELEDGHVTRFPGGYSAYAEERARKRSYQQSAYEDYRGEQRRLRTAIQRQREQASKVSLPSRMGNSEARLHKRSATAVEQKLNQAGKALSSRLNQLEVAERPRDDPSIRMRLGEADGLVSKTALTLMDFTLRVPGRTLLDRAEMRLPTGSRTALLGPNGCGKTTLLTRILSGDPRVRLAPGARIGWFGQDHQKSLAMDQTALQNAMAEAVQTQDVVRTVLARLGLRGDAVFKPASVLSGGERAKVALARILVGHANVLLMDEPTNHLDLFAMEALESVLSEYAGTLLLVSHDRALVDAVATRLVCFEGTSLHTFEDPLRLNVPQQGHKDREAQIDRMALDMRLAELAGRIAQPRKGDDVIKLREAYEALAQAKKDTAHS